MDQGAERAGGGTGVDGGSGEGEPLGDVGRAIGDGERSGGVEEDDVAAGALGAGEDVAGDVDGVVEVAGLERIEGSGGEAEGSRVDGGPVNLAVAEFGNVGDGGGGDFVEPVVGMDDHGARGAEAEESGGHLVEGGWVVDAEELVASARGVGERAEEVEDGGKGEGLADVGGVPGGRVMLLGKAEANGGAIEAAGLDGGRGVDVDAKDREEFGGASAAAAFVAMLGDADATLARSGGDECGNGGDVEGLGSAARAAGVEEDAGRGAGDGRGVTAHGAGGAGEFVDARAAGLDESKHGGDLRLWDLASQNRLEGGVGLALGEGLAFEELLEERGEIHVRR